MRRKNLIARDVDARLLECGFHKVKILMKGPRCSDKRLPGSRGGYFRNYLGDVSRLASKSALAKDHV